MLETDIRKIDFGKKNILKSHSVTLDTNLDCVMLLSSNDSKMTDLLYNKIGDAIIDRIHPKNVYKDFSSALENINAFLSGWMMNGKKIEGFHAIIGIYDHESFLFSTIGRASCYLHNSHKEIIEVTDHEDNPKEFGFISSGDVAQGEGLILSTIRLLDTLSKDDLKEGFEAGDILRVGENIEHILLHEYEGNNVGILTLEKPGGIEQDRKQLLQTLSHYSLRLFDNTFSKKILASFMNIKKSLLHKGKKVRQGVFALGIIVSAALLYSVISGFFYIASNTNKLEESKTLLVTAQNAIISASENMNDEDVFHLNIDRATDIVQNLDSKKLFLNDTAKLKDEMSILQKQFNGIESFEGNSENLVYELETENTFVKLVNFNNKMYAILRSSIIGPVIAGQEAQEYVFEGLSKEDSFIDATVTPSNIVLVTQRGKVVHFSGTQNFNFADVFDQTTWEKSPLINSFNENIYLLSDAGNQILRHKKSGQGYDAGVAYLTEDDASALGNIKSIAIDGGIYVLKNDGSIIKFFRTPKYRLENIVLQDVPKNYDISPESKVYISIAPNLKYFYMLLNNKILIFQPNSLRYQDVKSMKYIGQVEGKDIKIEEFLVKNDGVIYVGGNSAIYKLEFDVLEGELILK